MAEQEQEFTPEEAEALAEDILGGTPIEGDGFFMDDVARAMARVEATGEGDAEEGN